MELGENNKVWEEIRHLSHIGRSMNDIEQALTAKGYDNETLKEVLTFSFKNSLVDKEEMFVNLQQVANNQAADQAKKEEQEALEQKKQEQQIQLQKIEEEALREEEEHIKEVEEEIRLAYLEEQRKNEEYGTNVITQDLERQLAERKHTEEENRKQEEQRRLRSMVFNNY